MTADYDTNLRRQINRILYNDWDPIGVNGCAPGDEYSSYVPTVLRLLKDGANEQQISDLLHQIADEYMCMDTSTKPERNMLVAKKLQALMMDSNSTSNNQVVAVDPPVIQQQPRTSYQSSSSIASYQSSTTSSSIVSAEDRLGYKISAILFNDWDPIGMNDHGLLPDEYDIYVSSILRLLQDGANEQEISEQLQEIASDKMGLHTKAQVNMLVAKKLRALMIIENQVVADERRSTSRQWDYDGYCSYGAPDIRRSSSLLPPSESANDDRLRCKISSILFQDWDPIGCRCFGFPDDEYDDYVPSLLRLLKDGANEQQISLELQQIAKEFIGMNTKAEVNMMVAKKLRALMENDEVVVDERNYSPPGIRHSASLLPPNDSANDDRLRCRISSILFHDWDPIGCHDDGMPGDEYDSYVPSVLRLLKNGSNEQQISSELQKIAEENIGLNTKAEVNMLVAKKLRALMENDEDVADERSSYTYYQPEEFYRRYSLTSHHYGPNYNAYSQPLSIIARTTHDRIEDKINDILYYAWDPIGTTKNPCVVPRDEYECHVPTVLSLLKEGSHVQEISQLLHKIAKEKLNIDTKADVNTLVAMKLRALFNGYHSSPWSSY